MNLTPDPKGQAALILVERLMVLLVEDGVLLMERVVDAIATVVEVKREIAGTSESVVVSMASISLLQRVSRNVSAASPSKVYDAPEPSAA